MAFKDEYSDQLVKILRKLNKKNVEQFKIICKKRDEILENPERYKNLRHDLSGIKRVHIDKHFVLTFEVLADKGVVRFLDYGHHDQVYRR